MPLMSPVAIVRGLSLFHLALAFYFVTDPAIIADQNVIFLLGESMHLPRTSAFDQPTASTALAGLVFALLGLSDFAASTLAEPAALEYCASQALTRLLFFVGITAYSYLGRAKQADAWSESIGQRREAQNGLTFSWAFVEMLVWFWVFTSVREHKRRASGMVTQKR